MYDSTSKKPYCYCNDGYGGSSCSESASSAAQTSSTYDGYSVQLGLLITLLIIAVGLTTVVGFLVYRVTMLRKQHASSDYSSLPVGSEMVETVHF